SSAEKLLLCGDPEVYEWREIPAAQRETHLEAFLLDRGYYAPKIEREGESLLVEVGPEATIEEIDVDGFPARLEDPSPGFIGNAMVPDQLDEMEPEYLKQLSLSAYPCAEIETLAYPERAKVELKIDPSGRRRITEILRDKGKDFDSEELRRFEAFREGQFFDL